VADIDVWPMSTLLMADMVFCVADMVVADIVCGRYRRFPFRIGPYMGEFSLKSGTYFQWHRQDLVRRVHETERK